MNRLWRLTQVGGRHRGEYIGRAAWQRILIAPAVNADSLEAKGLRRSQDEVISPGRD
jgi:hypothetical protein